MPGPAAAAAAPTLTAAEIAALTGGTLLGDPAAVVSGVAPLATASASQLSFCGDARHLSALAASSAGVLLLEPAFKDVEVHAAARVIVKEPLSAMRPVLVHFHPDPVRPVGIHPTVILGRGVELGAEVALGPYVVIAAGAVIGDRAWIESHTVIGEGVRIGTDVHLHSQVTIYPRTVLGDRVEVHSGSRLGVDGFGYRFDGTQHRKIPHVARVVIESDVEIGANCTIDRGTLEDTVVGWGSKLDDMVHVGHNCTIGKLCLLMGQTGMAGSSILEDGVALAGQVGVMGHLTIGKGAQLGAQAGVIGNVPPGEIWSGYPARPHKEAMRRYAALERLIKMMRPLERLLADKS